MGKARMVRTMRMVGTMGKVVQVLKVLVLLLAARGGVVGLYKSQLWDSLNVMMTTLSFL